MFRLPSVSLRRSMLLVALTALLFGGIIEFERLRRRSELYGRVADRCFGWHQSMEDPLRIIESRIQQNEDFEHMKSGVTAADREFLSRATARLKGERQLHWETSQFFLALGRRYDRARYCPWEGPPRWPTLSQQAQQGVLSHYGDFSLTEAYLGRIPQRPSLSLEPTEF